MVAEYVQLMIMVIQGNGKIGDKTRGPEIPDILQVGNIFYRRVCNYGRKIIELEGSKKSIGVDNYP